MRNALASLLLFALVAPSLVAPSLVAQSRAASDFEIAQMERQLASQGDFAARLSGRLNLGDLRRARNEPSLARSEYLAALDSAARERFDARIDSDMSRYAEATSYAALAEAKLGRAASAVALLEESLRYTSDDPETWNLYASSMMVLGRPQKAASAARNAVAIAEAALRSSATTRTRLDVAIYQYALASALAESGNAIEARRVLAEVTTSLRSKVFEDLRRTVARTESFEIYSSARGDTAAFVSLLNRSQLRLADLHEKSGDLAAARAEYGRVLESRSDDASALTALARLATSDEERERRYAEAFDANPFSLTLARQYQKDLARAGKREVEEPTGSTTGARVRLALTQLARDQRRAARETLDALLAQSPANEMLRTLRREAESSASAFTMPSPEPRAEELRRVTEAFVTATLSPADRAALDRATFTSAARFDPSVAAEAGQTVLSSGTIEGTPFRFASPTAFAGQYDTAGLLRLTYRILGVTRSGGNDILLLEPLRVEVTQ